MTATVETVSEQLDLPIIPVERVPAGFARAITLSESDVGEFNQLHHFFLFTHSRCVFQLWRKPK